jgi:hypothetical protein
MTEAADGQRKAFRGRMHQLQLEHARKPSLLDRLERAGLIASVASDTPT